MFKNLNSVAVETFHIRIHLKLGYHRRIIVFWQVKNQSVTGFLLILS